MCTTSHKIKAVTSEPPFSPISQFALIYTTSVKFNLNVYMADIIYRFDGLYSCCYTLEYMYCLHPQLPSCVLFQSPLLNEAGKSHPLYLQWLLEQHNRLWYWHWNFYWKCKPVLQESHNRKRTKIKLQTSYIFSFSIHEKILQSLSLIRITLKNSVYSCSAFFLPSSVFIYSCLDYM